MSKLYSGLDYVVAKEGGANTGNIDATFANLQSQSQLNTQFVTVLSAMREEDTFNTTSILVEIGNLLASGSEEEALSKLEDLKNYHIYLLDKHHSDLRDREQMKEFIIREFGKLRVMILGRDRSVIPSEENDYSISRNGIKLSLKGFGEVFCTKFYSVLCKIRGIDIGVLDVSKNSKEIELSDTSSPEKVFTDLLEVFGKRIQEILSKRGNVLVPGYIGNIQGGIGNTIGSGYSDATAALLAVAIQNELGKNRRVLLEILKSVPGIMTTDPRLLRGSEEEAQVIEAMNFWIAKEIVGVRGAQAKLLNSYAMLPPVIQSGIGIRLRDPSTDHPGTLISHNYTGEKAGVEAILGRRNVAIVSISSFGMTQGFIAKISSIIKEYASVDVISTSETEFAFTVDMKEGQTRENMQAMVERLKNEYLNRYGDSIETSFHAGLIFCIGHDMKQPGILEKITGTLGQAGINIAIGSQGYMQRAVTIGVEEENDVEKAVQLLHKKFKLSTR